MRGYTIACLSQVVTDPETKQAFINIKNRWANWVKNFFKQAKITSGKI